MACLHVNASPFARAQALPRSDGAVPAATAARGRPEGCLEREYM